MLVKKNGEVASFKNSTGEVTNAIPNHTNMDKMKILVRNAGTPEGMNLLSADKPSNSILTMPPPSASALSTRSNATVNPSIAVPNLPANILADRHTESVVNNLNTSLLNSNNPSVKASTAATAGTMAGGS